MLTVKKRVAKGVAWLDKHGPEDWRERVSIEEFDIGSACKCILGQVFADKAKDDIEDDEFYYATGYEWVTEFNYKTRGFVSVAKNPIQFGFDYAWYGDSQDDYDALQEEWKRVLGRN